VESSTTILADAGASVASRLDDYDKLAGYEAFRRIKDNFEEPPRPSLDDVESVAAILRDSADYTLSQDSLSVVDGRAVMETAEGRTHRVSLSPGIVRRRTFDAARLEATNERAVDAKRRAIDSLVAGCQSCPVFLEVKPVQSAVTGAEIKSWSPRSRVRMMETVASLDYSAWGKEDGTLAMVTLTLPGEWEILAPDGATFKKLVEKFRRRWVRASGLPWRLLWKLEFQRRGAPHWHALMRVPVFVKGRIFTEWLSETWADVVNASREVDGMDKWGNDTSEYERHLRAGTAVDFSGKDFSDPRRISMYFLGHSAKSVDGKEYQHIVPELWQEKGKGPGRFWGYCGLDKAVVEIDVTERQAALLDRQLRKIKRARDWKMNVLREQGTAKRTGAPIPGSFEVHVPKQKKKLGRAAHRTANLRAWAAAQSDENLGRPGDASWSYCKRSAYAPFSGGQGGMVLVNDALALGLDLARYLKGVAYSV
jgi:hypothetical protein